MSQLFPKLAHDPRFPLSHVTPLTSESTGCGKVCATVHKPCDDVHAETPQLHGCSSN